LCDVHPLYELHMNQHWTVRLVGIVVYSPPRLASPLAAHPFSILKREELFKTF
jgi:hypothetical protein